jgi:hypothetical protein
VQAGCRSPSRRRRPSNSGRCARGGPTTRRPSGNQPHPPRHVVRSCARQGCSSQPSEGQIPILLGLMHSPKPAGLVLIIEIVLGTTVASAPKPGPETPELVQHDVQPPRPVPPTILRTGHRSRSGGCGTRASPSLGRLGLRPGHERPERPGTTTGTPGIICPAQHPSSSGHRTPRVTSRFALARRRSPRSPKRSCRAICDCPEPAVSATATTPPPPGPPAVSRIRVRNQRRTTTAVRGL